MNKKKKSRPGLKDDPAIRWMLSQAVENAFDGIGMVDMAGRVVYANPAARAMFGYDRKDGQGMRLSKFAAYPGKLSEIFKSVISKGRYNTTRTGLRKNGDKFPIHMTATLVRDHAGNNIGIMIIFRDLTESRAAEYKTRLSEERYRALVDSARDFIYSIDREGSVIAANKAANDLFGRKPGGITGKKLGDLFVPAVAKRYLKGIGQVFRTGKILTAENDLQPKKRGRRSIDTILTPVRDANGRVVSVLGITRDITRLKQAEAEVRRLNKSLEILIAERTAELRASEQKYRHLVENLQEGIWAIDRSARTTFVNRALARMLGYTAGEMTGKSVFDFLDAKARKILKDKLKNRRRGVKEIYDLEFVCKDGARFHGLVAGAPRMGVNGRYEGAIASILDITRRKQAEDQLREQSSEQAWLLKSMMNAFVIFDSVFDARGRFVSYRFRYINDAFERITGVKLKDVAGKTVHEVWPETEPEWIKNYGAVARSGRSMVFEMFHKPTAKFYHCNVYRPWHSQKRFCVIFEDITSQRRHEARMAAINACFLKHGKDPARNINALVALCGELLGGDCALYSRLEGGLLCSRGQWHVPPDYDPNDKPRGHICYDLIRQDSCEWRVVRKLQSTRYARTDSNVRRYGLETYIGQAVRCEGRAAGALCVVYRKDFNPDEDDRKIMGIIAAAIGVEEERRRAQQDLVFKNTLLSAQQEASIDGILVVDENGKIIMFNRRFAEIWGIPDKILALRSDERALLFVLNRLADPEEFLKKVKYLYAHKKETSRDEISLADGRILDRYSAPLFGPDGKYYGRAWYFRDITARKQAEENLAASEERFREISLSMTDIAYSCIRAPGKAPALNWVAGAVQALTGHTEKEFLALGCWQKLVLEDDLPVFVKNVSGLAPGAAGRCELRLCKKDGSSIWVVSSCRCVADRSCPGRTILYGGLSDIDRRKKIEQSLHESEEKFSKAFHNAPVMILITALGDGRIIEVNDSFIDATGFSRAEIIGKRTVELGFIKPEEMQKIADFVRAKGGLRNFELKVRGKDGSELDCMLSFDLFVLAGKKCLLTVAKDITEIRQAENERRLSAEKYHAIFMESPIGIELFDESGRLVMINKACLDIFGVVDEKELNDFNLFCVPNLTEDRKARLRAGELLRYQAPFDFEQLKQSRLYRTRHSGVIWLDVLIVPLRASPGGLLVQVQDITGRMQAQDKLEQANRRLKEALDQLKKTERQVIQNERLGALGQMASGISHEFNNILVPIVGYADLLLTKEDKLNDRQELLKMLRMILAAALDAREVIKRLQDFARPKDEDSREMVFLPELAENVVMLLRPKWKEEMGLKGVLINIKSEFRDMPPVQCIRAQVKEVLTNIILNAVDALPEGGTITIRGRHLKPENAVELQIVDTGTGISPAVQQHIFEPYFTTKGGERSGLGLAITHGIVSAHNGTIKFDSALGKGTTVTIRLPVGQPVAPAVEARLPEAASRPLRILFIDDNENVRLLIAEFLKADGHTVALAAEGHEGLAQAGEGRFDLVITDSAMPDMSGGELAAAIKTIKQDLPVIMLTGFGDIMNAKREIPVGVEMVLAKPITQEGLRKAISKIMAGRA